MILTNLSKMRDAIETENMPIVTLGKTGRKVKAQKAENRVAGRAKTT